ncbi:hypothetical protein GYA49_02970 [Candidatus Beckwithbacteria bacterium]|nr:hypothetical protein [Candidatus Beckwithbacteria bacterium]
MKGKAQQVSEQKRKMQAFLESKRGVLPARQSFNKNFGAQARVAAMHSIQRASGRRGN